MYSYTFFCTRNKSNHPADKRVLKSLTARILRVKYDCKNEKETDRRRGGNESESEHLCENVDDLGGQIPGVITDMI